MYDAAEFFVGSRANSMFFYYEKVKAFTDII